MNWIFWGEWRLMNMASAPDMKAAGTMRQWIDLQDMPF